MVDIKSTPPIDEGRLDIFDLSGGIQRKTTPFLKKLNELNLILNGVLDKIGGIKRRDGYQQLGNTLTNTTTSSSTSSTSTSSTSTSSTSTSTSTTA